VRKRIILGLFIALAAAVAGWMELHNRIPFNSVLEIRLNRAIEDQRAAAASSKIPADPTSENVSLNELLTAIDAARDDRRVGGIVVRVGDANGWPGVLAEIGAHIRAFRKSGKPSICFYDEEDDDVRAETLASACEKRVGEGPGNDVDIDVYFNVRLGEDNWFPIEMGEYLKKTRGGS
jgi:hypothetical protein